MAHGKNVLKGNSRKSGVEKGKVNRVIKAIARVVFSCEIAL